MRTIIGGPTHQLRDPIPPGGAGTSCFHEETMIVTNNGSKMIKNIDLTIDKIWNPINQKWMELSRKTVTLWQGEVCKIATSENELITTSNHPFMLKDGTVLKAENLEVGDVLDNGSEGIVIKAMQLNKVQEYVIVHNLVFKNAGTADCEHFVEANGIPSGILHLQDKVANASLTKALQLN